MIDLILMGQVNQQERRVVDISTQESSKKRPMISVLQVNKETIIHCKNVFEMFDSLCPLSLYSIREWEGRIKMIVTGKSTISVK